MHKRKTPADKTLLSTSGAAIYRSTGMQNHRGRVPSEPGSVPAGQVEVHLQRVLPRVLHLRPTSPIDGTSSLAAEDDVAGGF